MSPRAAAPGAATVGPCAGPPVARRPSPVARRLRARHPSPPPPARRAVPRRAASEEPPLSRESHAGRPTLPVQPRCPDGHRPGRTATGLSRFNSAPAAALRADLLACCGSEQWAGRLLAHRPYPDEEALLAAADEASYDLPPAELATALAAESRDGGCRGALRDTAPAAARTALAAAYSAYESSFGHAFVMSLADRAPDEYLDEVLTAIRARLGHDPEKERSVAAEELRRVARTRLAHLLARHADPAARPEPRRPVGS